MHNTDNLFGKELCLNLAKPKANLVMLDRFGDGPAEFMNGTIKTYCEK